MREIRRGVLLLTGALGMLIAQNGPAAGEIQHRLGLVATRAIANFRSADSIEARLRERGMTLHSDLAVLRAQLEAALDETDAAIGRNDLTAANGALDRAEALLNRYAARLGS